MEITKLEISNYKSIKSPVSIHFKEGLPTVLIGKNGSGKSNILEALMLFFFKATTNIKLEETYCEYRAFPQSIYNTDENLTTSPLFGKRCVFLETKNVANLFDQRCWATWLPAYSNLLLEGYLQYRHPEVDIREELRKSRFHGSPCFSEIDAKELEKYLYNNLPDFEKSGYDSISVEIINGDTKHGNVNIFLNEITGNKVKLDESSEGRKWYFSYSFMKNSLIEGDILIIDEPAASLHPALQFELLTDLVQLSNRGVRVIYSTHSPSMIPKNWESVHFVTMTKDGTRVNCMESSSELISKIKDIAGTDIFDLQRIVDAYTRGDRTKIGKSCYEAVKNIDKDLENAAKELLVSVDTIKSWKRKGDHFRCPKLENVISISHYAKIDIDSLLN